MAAVMDKDRYRAAALGTRAYVKANLPLGASNDWKFYLRGPAAVGYGLGSHLMLMKAIKHDSESQGNAARLAGHPYKKGSRRLTRAMLEIWSRDGLRFGCGNCGVQSAVAFIRLRDHWKVFPLDWVQVAKGDHGFIVIGRNKDTDASNAGTWNEEAVVCDPWRDVVQAAIDYALKHEKLELLYRQESAGDVPDD